MSILSAPLTFTPRRGADRQSSSLLTVAVKKATKKNEILGGLHLIEQVFPGAQTTNDFYMLRTFKSEWACFIATSSRRRIVAVTLLKSGNDARLGPYADVTRPRLDSFGVDAEVRSRGVGKQLLHGVLSWSVREWKSTSCSLEVSKRNHSAYKLYWQFGFRPTEQRGGLYIPMEVKGLQEPDYGKFLSEMRFNRSHFLRSL